MNMILRTSLLTLAALSFACGGEKSAPPPPKTEPVVAKVEPTPQPASLSAGTRRLAEAQEILTRDPENLYGYQLLASAWMFRARETGDFSLNTKADQALTKAQQLEVDNPITQRLQAVMFLTWHQFEQALDLGRKLILANPRDHEAWGVVVDALVELGRYPEAIEAADAMVTVRPNAASYSRVSWLRTLHGDDAGAVEAMRMAVSAADAGDREGLAWFQVHLAQTLANVGQVDEALGEVERALVIFPNYPAALTWKGHLTARKGDIQGAVSLLESATQRLPLPDTLIYLGDLYARLGRANDAQKQYELATAVEGGAPGLEGKQGVWSRRLALMWADQDINLEQAETIARKERETRQDVFSHDLLAWILLKRGKTSEALKESELALRLGTHDAGLYYHRGMIHLARGDKKGAKEFLEKALGVDPAFDVVQANIAREKLAGL